MAKQRDWTWTEDTVLGSNETDVLWAIVERLTALVAIGDELEEVYDVIANHLTFGGQPVGSMTPTEAFEEGKRSGGWACKKMKGCAFFDGHQGACQRPQDHSVGTDLCLAVEPETQARCMLLANHDSICAFPQRVCQCMKPDLDASDVCGKCGFPASLGDLLSGEQDGA